MLDLTPQPIVQFEPFQSLGEKIEMRSAPEDNWKVMHFNGKKQTHARSCNENIIHRRFLSIFNHMHRFSDHDSENVREDSMKNPAPRPAHSLDKV
jgi:hypothetical protein